MTTSSMSDSGNGMLLSDFFRRNEQILGYRSGFLGRPSPSLLGLGSREKERTLVGPRQSISLR